MGMVTAFFLANRTVKGMLSVAAVQTTIYGLTMEQAGNQFGQLAPGSTAGTGTGIRGGQVKFFGTPVLTVDQMPVMGDPTRVSVHEFPGGHMIYTRDESRIALRADVTDMYSKH